MTYVETTARIPMTVPPTLDQIGRTLGYAADELLVNAVAGMLRQQSPYYSAATTDGSHDAAEVAFRELARDGLRKAGRDKARLNAPIHLVDANGATVWTATGLVERLTLEEQLANLRTHLSHLGQTVTRIVDDLSAPLLDEGKLSEAAAKLINAALHSCDTVYVVDLAAPGALQAAYHSRLPGIGEFNGELVLTRSANLLVAAVLAAAGGRTVPQLTGREREIADGHGYSGSRDERVAGWLGPDADRDVQLAWVDGQGKLYAGPAVELAGAIRGAEAAGLPPVASVYGVVGTDLLPAVREVAVDPVDGLGRRITTLTVTLTDGTQAATRWLRPEQG